MNCSNTLCISSKGSPLPFTCDHCKEQHYCSKSCKLEDWNTGHSLICEKARAAKLKKVQESCPFVKLGQFLTTSEADTLAPKNENVYSNYEPARNMGKSCTLGKGSYGEVILMRQKATGQLVAMKIIEKKVIGNPTVLKSLVNEIEIQKRIIHENVVRLYSHVEDPKNIYIIMEYANKGSLFQLIRKKGKLSEKQAFFFFTQVCSAIHFLHSHQLMHRDIKPENLLITENGILKLCDFGCCTQYDARSRMTFCGTIEYMAPEIVKRDGYGEKADVWSLGVLLYEMLHGYAPFHGRREQDTISMILDNKLLFGEIPEDAKDLIQELMKEDPKQRPEAWEVFLHPWMKRLQREFGIPDTTEELKVSKVPEEQKNESIHTKGAIAKSLIYNPSKVLQDPPEVSDDAPINSNLKEETSKENNNREQKVEDLVQLITRSPPQPDPLTQEKPEALQHINQATSPVKPLPEPLSQKAHAEPQQEQNPVFTLPEDIVPERPKMQPQVDEIINPKVSVKPSLEEAFVKYERGRLTKNTKIRPTENDKDNIFYKENRRSTWAELGFPTFRVEPEEDPLLHVNKFLEEVSQEPRIKWQDALGDFKDRIEELTSKLNQKLLGNNEKIKEEEEDLNASYNSDDYAFQRSETVLKAVNYLDDIDADPTMRCSKETAQEILQENERLKKVCKTSRKVHEKSAKKKKKREVKDEQKGLKEPDNNKLERHSEEAKIEEPSVYKESIDKIMGTLLKMKNGDTKFYQRKTCVVNVSRRGEKLPKNVEGRDSLWNKIITFGDKDGL